MFQPCIITVAITGSVPRKEDTIRFDKTRLAAGNAEPVARVAALCAEYGRSPATVAEARDILSLPRAEASAA